MFMVKGATREGQLDFHDAGRGTLGRLLVEGIRQRRRPVWRADGRNRRQRI